MRLWWKWRYCWRGEAKFESFHWFFFFSPAKLEDKYMTFIQLLWTKRWAIQSAMCLQSRTRWEPTPELVCLGGRSQKAQKCSHEEKTCRVCALCISNNGKSFLILQRVTQPSQVKTFPSLLWTKGLIKGKKSYAKGLPGYLLHKESHIVWWQQKKQYPSPMKICIFTAKQRLICHNWPQNQKCGCWCAAEHVNETRTFC